MTTTPDPPTRRPNAVRVLAERLAHDPQMVQAVAGAIRGVLPTLVQRHLDDLVVEHGGSLHLWLRKQPTTARAHRDDRLRALLATGTPPALAAQQVGCSRSHAYKVHARMRARP